LVLRKLKPLRNADEADCDLGGNRSIRVTAVEQRRRHVKSRERESFTFRGGGNLGHKQEQFGRNVRKEGEVRLT